MYYETFEKYKKEVAGCFFLLVMLMIIYTVGTAISHIGKVRLDIHTVPNDALVTIDNKQIDGDTYYTQAGTYKVTVSHSGFTSTSSTIIITPNKDQNILATSLTPQSNEAKQWATNHQSDYKNNEQYGAIQARQTGQYMLTQNPIIKDLPYQDPYYKIAYQSADNKTITLTVASESPRYRYLAIQKLRDMGYEPTDYTIVFTDYYNPLEAL